MALLTTSLGDLSFAALQPAAPLTEGLEWYTDIIPSYNGSEERLKLRKAPRHTFSASYFANNLQSQDIFNTVYGSTTRNWAIPVWSEAQYVGSLALGATGAPVGNATADLRAGGLALLWGARNAHSVVTAASVSAGAITFDPLELALRQAYVIPLRVGRLQPQLRKQTNGSESRWTLGYDVDDQLEITSAAPAQYLGEDIYYEAGLIMGETIPEDFRSNLVEDDHTIGVVKISSPWIHPRTMRDFHALTSTPLEAWNLRKWLHRRSGRYRAFWQPSFENDFRLAPTAPTTLTTSLLVEPDSFNTLATEREHIAIQGASAWYPRKITSVDVVGDKIRLNFTGALNIPKDTVKRISYLGLKRLDTDRVELNWASGICQTSFRVLEISP